MRWLVLAMAAASAAATCPVNLKDLTTKKEKEDYDFVCDMTLPKLHYDGKNWSEARPVSDCHYYTYLKGNVPEGCKAGLPCIGCWNPLGAEVDSVKLMGDDCSPCNTPRPDRGFSEKPPDWYHGCPKSLQNKVHAHYDFICDTALPRLYYDRARHPNRYSMAAPHDGCHHYVYMNGTAPSGCAVGGSCPACAKPAGIQVGIVSLMGGTCRPCSHDRMDEVTEKPGNGNRFSGKPDQGDLAKGRWYSKRSSGTALDDATQVELDRRAEHGKDMVDVRAREDKEKCAGDLNTEEAKRDCQIAKDATLKETIAAIEAIKEANRRQRSVETRRHQEAEAASMQAIDEEAAALQQAIARQREESEEERTLADEASLSKWEEKASFGTLKAASVVQSPIAVVTVSGVLGLAVVAAVISRRSHSVPLSRTHALVRGSDETDSTEHCRE